MTAPKIRGYGVIRQLAYAKENLPAEILQPVLREIEEQCGTRDFDANSWYPREVSIKLLRAIAAAQRDEAGAARALAQCGRHVGDEINKTYMRLLMRILTPTIWAKKAPSHWTRDHTAGRLEPDVSDVKNAHIVMRHEDVAGFDHIGAMSVGVLELMLEALGKKSVSVVQQGWSLATPGPNQVVYDIRWQE
jgi:uncharacterized protein (TIGR02265 family)